jgi:Multiubiquitin
MNEKEDQKADASQKDKEVVILVNTRPTPYNEKEITFRQVVELAFPGAQFIPQIVYTVSYSKGIDKKPKGSLVDNESVHVKNGMVFDVDRTDNS